MRLDLLTVEAAVAVAQPSVSDRFAPNNLIHGLYASISASQVCPDYPAGYEPDPTLLLPANVYAVSEVLEQVLRNTQCFFDEPPES